ncbi:hypothetical protein V8E55_008828 [Tylopilus felleus]
MPSQNPFEAQSERSTAQRTAEHEPQHTCPPSGEGSSIGTTVPSPPHAHPAGTLAPEFLAGLWRLRLDLAIFKLERRALPILNVFRNEQHPLGRTVLSLRRQSHRILEANAASGSTLSPQARTRLSRRNIWVPLRHTVRCALPYHGTHKAWLKWRGPLPMKENLGRRFIRGSAVFAYRCRYGRHLVTRFWVRQRIEPHLVRWSRAVLRPSSLVSEW